MDQTKKVYDFLQKHEKTTNILRFLTKFFSENILDYISPYIADIFSVKIDEALFRITRLIEKNKLIEI